MAVQEHETGERYGLICPSSLHEDIQEKQKYRATHS